MYIILSFNTFNLLLRFIPSKSYDFHVHNLYSTFNVRNTNGLCIWNILNYIFNVNLKYYSPSHNYQTCLKQSVNLNMPITHKEFCGKKVVNACISLCIMPNINLLLNKNKNHLKDLNLNHVLLY